MTVRNIFLSVAAITLCADAFSASFGMEEIRSHGKQVKIIVHKSDKPIRAVAAMNYLDPIRNFHCESAAGCIVSVSGTVQITNVPGPALCSFVDQAPTFPACDGSDTSGAGTELLNSLASATVAQGVHTFQSGVSAGSAGGTINYWEMQYTVYERD